MTVVAGGSMSVDVVIPARAFADWDNGWHYELGEFTLSAGFSVDDLPLSKTVELTGNHATV